MRPASDFERGARDREGARYGQALEWARVFLEGRSFSIFGGQTACDALLFPMERVFEDYVATGIARAAAQEGGTWRVRAKDASRHLFDEGCGSVLEPDIVMRDAGGRVVVLDTKWKLGDVARSDLYQMYAYGKRYRADRVLLVYPKGAGAGQSTEKGWRCTEGSPFEVQTHHIDLLRRGDAIADLYSAATRQV